MSDIQKENNARSRVAGTAPITVDSLVTVSNAPVLVSGERGSIGNTVRVTGSDGVAKKM